MFVVVLEYVRPLEEIDRLLTQHRDFLERHYAAGRFIASGRLHPRTGGVILARCADRGEMESVLAEDPFRREGVARYTVLEFEPGMYDPRFAPFVTRDRA